MTAADREPRTPAEVRRDRLRIQAWTQARPGVPLSYAELAAALGRSDRARTRSDMSSVRESVANLGDCITESAYDKLLGGYRFHYLTDGTAESYSVPPLQAQFRRNLTGMRNLGRQARFTARNGDTAEIRRNADTMARASISFYRTMWALRASWDGKGGSVPPIVPPWMR